MKALFFSLTLVLSFFLLSCDDSTSSNQETSQLGHEGYHCKANQVCYDGLVCNRNNICEKDKTTDPNLGKEGYGCKAGNTCDGDLVCKDDVCKKDTSVDPDLGKEGKACKPNNVCNTGLVCKNNICEKDASSELGKEGKPCKAYRECDESLFCNSQDICEALVGELGSEGNPCKEDGSCDASLMCTVEGVCLNATDFHQGDEGQKCRILEDNSEFCYEGLQCGGFGKCDLDCSQGNDSLCDGQGDFDFSPYAGVYEMTRFAESTGCGENNYASVEQDYGYFELKYEEYYGFDYLNFHECEHQASCDYTAKTYYKVVDYSGQNLMEYAIENEDGSCTYTAVTTYIRSVGNTTRIRYIIDEARIEDPSDPCTGANVKNYYGDLECARIRIIDGVRGH